MAGDKGVDVQNPPPLPSVLPSSEGRLWECPSTPNQVSLQDCFLDIPTTDLWGLPTIAEPLRVSELIAHNLAGDHVLAGPGST